MSLDENPRMIITINIGVLIIEAKRIFIPHTLPSMAALIQRGIKFSIVSPPFFVVCVITNVVFVVYHTQSPVKRTSCMNTIIPKPVKARWGQWRLLRIPRLCDNKEKVIHFCGTVKKQFRSSGRRSRTKKKEKRKRE